MSNEILASKIDLLQEQIDNIEKSGFYTEKQIDKLVYPLCKELDSLKKQLVDSLRQSGIDHDFTVNEAILETKNVTGIIKSINAFLNPVFDIEVTDAEILTPNSIKA